MVCLLIFGLLSSIIFPIFNGLIPFCVHLLFHFLFQPLYQITISRWFGEDIGSSKSSYERPPGHVTDRELLNLALEEKSSFLLDMYKDDCQKRTKAKREDKHQRNMFEQVTFPVVLLSFIDYLVPSLPDGNSIVRELSSASGEFWNFILIIFALLAFLALKWAWFSDPDHHTEDWIYYPPLYKEIEEKRRKRAAENDAMEQRMRAKVEEERRTRRAAEVDGSARGRRWP